MPHNYSIRVYYEDTDAGGVVYYANYLKFAERARTEFLRSLGFSQRQLATNENTLFVVHHANLQLIRPAFLDDEITIKTAVTLKRSTSLEFTQVFYRAENIISKALVEVVAVNNSLKPKRIPETLLNLIRGHKNG
jgi:acyl-CoA thioester hydrolase